MYDVPLPRLMPGDPRNRLSAQARRRVVRADAECNRIQWETHATARARQLSDSKTRYLLNQADLKGARTVLKVLATEYVDAGLTLREYWTAMRGEIEGVANSFSLYDAQRRLLEAEFLTPPEQKVHARACPFPATSMPAKPDSVGAKIQRLRVECDLTEEDLAEQVDMDNRACGERRRNASTEVERAARTSFNFTPNRANNRASRAA